MIMDVFYLLLGLAALTLLVILGMIALSLLVYLTDDRTALRELAMRRAAEIGGVLLGRRLPTSQAPGERLSDVAALAILSSNALSSVAYAPEELLLVLVLAGSVGLNWTIPISTVAVSVAAGVAAITIISCAELLAPLPEVIPEHYVA